MAQVYVFYHHYLFLMKENIFKVLNKKICVKSLMSI